MAGLNETSELEYFRRKPITSSMEESPSRYTTRLDERDPKDSCTSSYLTSTVVPPTNPNDHYYVIYSPYVSRKEEERKRRISNNDIKEISNALLYGDGDESCGTGTSPEDFESDSDSIANGEVIEFPVDIIEDAINSEKTGSGSATQSSRRTVGANTPRNYFNRVVTSRGHNDVQSINEGISGNSFSTEEAAKKYRKDFYKYIDQRPPVGDVVTSEQYLEYQREQEEERRKEYQHLEEQELQRQREEEQRKQLQRQREEEQRKELQHLQKQELQRQREEEKRKEFQREHIMFNHLSFDSNTSGRKTEEGEGSVATDDDTKYYYEGSEVNQGSCPANNISDSDIHCSTLLNGTGAVLPIETPLTARYPRTDQTHHGNSQYAFHRTPNKCVDFSQSLETGEECNIIATEAIVVDTLSLSSLQSLASSDVSYTVIRPSRSKNSEKRGSIGEDQNFNDIHSSLSVPLLSEETKAAMSEWCSTSNNYNQQKHSDANNNISPNRHYISDAPSSVESPEVQRKVHSNDTIQSAIYPSTVTPVKPTGEQNHTTEGGSTNTPSSISINDKGSFLEAQAPDKISPRTRMDSEEAYQFSMKISASPIHFNKDFDGQSPPLNDIRLQKCGFKNDISFEELDLPGALKSYHDACKMFVASLQGPDGCRCRLTECDSHMKQLRAALSFELSCSKALQTLADEAVRQDEIRTKRSLEVNRSDIVLPPPLDIRLDAKDVITDESYDTYIEAEQEELDFMRSSVNVQTSLLRGRQMAEDGLREYCIDTEDERRPESIAYPLKHLDFLEASLRQNNDRMLSDINIELLENCLFEETFFSVLCGLECKRSTILSTSGYPSVNDRLLRMPEANHLITSVVKTYTLLIKENNLKGPVVAPWRGLAAAREELRNTPDENDVCDQRDSCYRPDGLINSSTHSDVSPTTSLFFKTASKHKIQELFEDASNLDRKGVLGKIGNSYVRGINKMKRAVLMKVDPLIVIKNAIKTSVTEESSNVTTVAEVQSGTPLAKVLGMAKSLSPSELESYEVSNPHVAEQIHACRHIIKSASIMGCYILDTMLSIKNGTSTISGVNENVRNLINTAADNAHKLIAMISSTRPQLIYSTNNNNGSSNTECKTISVLEEEKLVELCGLASEFASEIGICYNGENELHGLTAVLRSLKAECTTTILNSKREARCKSSSVNSSTTEVSESFTDNPERYLARISVTNNCMASQLRENKEYLYEKNKMLDLLVEEIAKLRLLEKPVFFPTQLLTTVTFDCNISITERGAGSSSVVFLPDSIRNYGSREQRCNLIKTCARANSQAAHFSLLILGNSVLHIKKKLTLENSSRREFEEDKRQNIVNLEKIERFSAELFKLQKAQEVLLKAVDRVQKLIDYPERRRGSMKRQVSTSNRRRLL